MQLFVNGQPREVPAKTTLRDLLGMLKLEPQKVAIEVNRRLARSGQYDQPLSAGDKVEIVTFVGGG